MNVRLRVRMVRKRRLGARSEGVGVVGTGTPSLMQPTRLVVKPGTPILVQGSQLRRGGECEKWKGITKCGMFGSSGLYGV